MSDDKFDLTRRKALLGLGGIGAGAALGGAGTMAVLNDSHSSTNTVTAGKLDLKIDWTEHYNGEQIENQELTNNPGPVFELGDVKPGDWGEATISLHNYHNPAWVHMAGELTSNAENGVNDPESRVDSTGGGSGFDLGFDSLSGPEGSWKTDRSAPETWEVTTKEGESVLHVNLDEAGETSGFYNEQGKKYLNDGHPDGYWQTGYGSELHWRFYLDAAWEDDDQQHDFGIWAQLGDGDGDTVNWSVLHYVDSDASDQDTPGFKLFRGGDDWSGSDRWTWLGNPSDVDPMTGGFVDVTARLVDTGGGAELVWFVDGTRVASDATSPEAATIQLPILNHRNYGTDADYYHSTVSLADPLGGELADEILVDVWYDGTENDEDGGNNVFESDEIPIASGTLRDVLAQLDDGRLLRNQVVDGTDGTNGDGAACSTSDEWKIDETPTVGDTTPNGEVEITGVEREDGEVVAVEWESSSDICLVAVKGGPSTATYEYDCVQSGGPDFSPENTGNPNRTYYEISNVQFYYCEDGDGGDGNGGQCWPNSTTQYIGFKWRLPKEVGNEVQTDSVTFDLKFHAQQCRHNDDPKNPYSD